MIQYILTGLALGAIYAIASSGIVITYVSAGILNFAFGAMAYLVARFFYFIYVEQQWPLVPAALVSLLVVAPALGVFLWAVLFRFLRLASPVIKVVATVGLSVAIPPIVTLIFGNEPIPQVPGLAPRPLTVFHPFGVALNTDQILTYACMALVLIVGAVVLRRTDAGLRVRAMVDSHALTSVSGISPARVSMGVWAVSSFLAGLAGILVAPTTGMTASGFTTLMAAAFAAVVAGRLRNLPTAVVVSLIMGVVTGIVQKYLPPESTFTAAVLPSIPFVFMLVFLVYYVVRSGSVDEAQGIGGALDRAIRPAEVEGSPGSGATGGGGRRDLLSRGVAALIGLAILFVLASVLQGFWIGLFAQGMAFALAFLSYTLVTGEGRMIWLCQITFAGLGAIAASQLAGTLGWPVLPAILVGGVAMAPIGVLIGLITIRFGDLYVALVTLTFGLLVETLVFKIPDIYQFGAGSPISRPGFAQDDHTFSYLLIGVFVVVAILLVNLRRSTTGLALGAVRGSEPGARTIGLSGVPLKLLAAGLAAALAGIGGGFIASYTGAAMTDSFATFAGLIWLAVLVSIGVRSITAAAVAGLSFAILPGVFTSYLPTQWGEVPAALFGLGAIMVARNPDGVVAMHARQLRTLMGRIRPRAATTVQGPPPTELVQSQDVPVELASTAQDATTAERKR